MLFCLVLPASASVLMTPRAPPTQFLSYLRPSRSSSLRMGGPLEVDDTWQTTSTGLQYLDVTVGSGEMPEKGNTIKVDYTGWVESTGKEFDTSVGRGPIAFSLGAGRVIKGWDEGIAGMKIGGKRRLSIPAELAYGEKGAGDDIPPNARLQFETELVSIEQGFDGFLSSFPGGKVNFGLVCLLLISFIPYLLPPEAQPSFYQIQAPVDTGAFPTS